MQSAKVAMVLFKQLFDEVHQASSIEAAEASKLMENVYRAVNIALANEWGEICAQLNLDVWEIIKLASTKPFGFQAFYPGPGVGGIASLSTLIIFFPSLKVWAQMQDLLILHVT